MHTHTLLFELSVIEVEDKSVPWAVAGTACTLHLVSIDPIQLSIGTVLCSPSDPIPLAASFTARIIVFDIQIPITAGATVSGAAFMRPFSRPQGLDENC